MRLHRIVDLSFEEVSSANYDVAFFASGYELRCTHVPLQLDATHTKRAVVLGFSNMRDHMDRLKNDEYYRAQWSPDQKVVDASDEGPLYPLLQSVVPKSREIVRLLVDYSSMSRLWYAGILNWARFVAELEGVEIDLVYAVGKHPDHIRPMVIRDILSIPGCEGGAVPLYKSVAVFGLGLDATASLCVLDRLEPDIVYSYLASPGGYQNYVERVRADNKEIIGISSATLDLPLSSVEQVYRYLAELIEPHKKDADIIIVPMGPKPHVLAAILLALRFEEISCLRVSRRDRPEDIRATGQIVCSRVKFVNDQGVTSEQPI